MKQVWKAAEEVLQRTIPVSIGPRREGDPAVLCANPAKLKAELGWLPGESDLKHIIPTAWNWKLPGRGRVSSAPAAARP